MREENLLSKLQQQNRTKYQQLMNKRQMVSDRTQEHTGVIQDYDPSSSNYTVRLASGRTVAARAISNSSELCLGAAVSLVTTGGIPVIDAMPL